MSKGSTNWVWIPLFSHNIISRGGARFITVVSMIIQLSHLPYLREHTQHGLGQVCHPLNALAMMTVKINEQIGTLKRSLISWGQMFLACTWTISRHMGSTTVAQVSLPVFLSSTLLLPRMARLVNVYQKSTRNVAIFSFQVMKNYYIKAVWGHCLNCLAESELAIKLFLPHRAEQLGPAV